MGYTHVLTKWQSQRHVEYLRNAIDLRHRWHLSSSRSLSFGVVSSVRRVRLALPSHCTTAFCLGNSLRALGPRPRQSIHSKLCSRSLQILDWCRHNCICHARKSSSTAAVPWRRVELVGAPGAAQLVGVGVVVPMMHGTSTVDPEMEQAHFRFPQSSMPDLGPSRLGSPHPPQPDRPRWPSPDAALCPGGAGAPTSFGSFGLGRRYSQAALGRHVAPVAVMANVPNSGCVVFR